MDYHKLADMFRGWFVGDFNPTLLRTRDVEVAVKTYAAGASEDAHVHKVATEITVIVVGSARIGGHTLHAGDIVVVHPGEACAFQALTEVVTTVVKIPGATNDKYPLPQSFGDYTGA